MDDRVPGFEQIGRQKTEGSLIRIGRAKERVVMGDSPAYRFEVAERAGRWLVVAFSGE